MRVATSFPNISPGRIQVVSASDRPGQAWIGLEAGSPNGHVTRLLENCHLAGSFAFLNPTAARMEIQSHFRSFSKGGDWFDISPSAATAYLKYLQEVEKPSRIALARLIEQAVELGLL